ncbi:MAG: molybdopterin oxidoreductase family protein, partial [Candidatus Aenigmatarchaeota archaeon]
DIDTLLVVGSDPATNYPVFFNKLEERRDEIDVVSVQSIVNRTTMEIGDIEVSLEPGTEMVLLNGIINEVISSGSYNKNREDINNFSILKQISSEYTADYVCEECSIKKDSFEKVCDIINNSKCLGIFHGMGFTQHVNSMENIHTLLNLMILKSGKVLTLRGEVNVQGVGDMGCLPNTLPSGPLPTSEKLEEYWKADISQEKGKNIMEGFLLSPVKAALVADFNPAQSMPNLDKVHGNLEKIFLVYMGPYSNKTSEFADVILPTPVLLERNGTVTNGERRVRKINKVQKCYGDSKAEWQIFKEFSKWFNMEDLFNYDNESNIFEEICEVIPDYSDLDVKQIYLDKEDMFARQEIKYESFQPEEFDGVDFSRSDKYPYLLTTFRSKFQFLTGEMSSKSKTLNKTSDDPCFYMNSGDMKEEGINDGDSVELKSSVSSLVGKVKPSDNIPAGIVGSNFHSKKFLINKLMPTQFDEESFIPNYKAVGVSVEKL